MNSKMLISLIGGAGIVAGAVAGGATASSAAGYSGFVFYANMGGSQVQVLGQTVASGATAQSGIQGVTFPATDSNSVANAKVNNVLSLGGVTTSESAALVNGNAQVTASGETTGVNLLNGLVTIDAVKSSVTTLFTPGANGVATGSANTTFVGIHVLGANIPINVPQNYTVTIPGVATLKLNSVAVTKLSDGVDVFSNALDLTLLQARLGEPSGTEIVLNPSNVANMNVLTPGPAVLNGIAYATQVTAAVPNVAAAQSGMTAELLMPRGGTANQVQSNKTASVSVPQILSVGAVTSSQHGATTIPQSNLSETYEIGKVSVLSGLVTADALEGTATDTKRSDGSYLPGVESQFVNLKVGGQAIPVNVSPNTVINVANLATVTINKQVAYKNVAAVYGVIVTLTVAKYGLPAGAQIQVGVAIAGINLTG